MFWIGLILLRIGTSGGNLVRLSSARDKMGCFGVD
jgi:hypothetical protein